jgi:hypothetical protein
MNITPGMTLSEHIREYEAPYIPTVAYKQIWRTPLGLGLVVWTSEHLGQLESLGLLVGGYIYTMHPLDLAINSTLEG